MTENSTPAAPSGEGDPSVGQLPEDSADLTQTTDRLLAPDYSLQHMADFANHARAGLQVTVFTDAGTFSGAIFGAEEFYEEIAKKQLQGSERLESVETYQLIKKFVEMFFDRAADAWRSDRENEVDNDVMLTRYLHLKDAKLLTGSGELRDIGPLRLLLSHVTGWTVGGLRW